MPQRKSPPVVLPDEKLFKTCWFFMLTRNACELPVQTNRWSAFPGIAWSALMAVSRRTCADPMTTPGLNTIDI